ncbi:MAG: murD [Parachlamydiales bacterium]|nr:murD [Parachlamydiales bacterium]
MNKKAIVIGLGVSGRSCVELLFAEKKSVLALDKNAGALMSDPNVKTLLSRGLELDTDQKQVDWSQIDQVVISPGIALTHPVAAQALVKKIEVIGEIELAFRRLQNPCIGVTGTNGKTTVVLLICHILRMAGMKAQSLGNIGTSLSSYALSPDPNEILVVELSSFQLETIEKKCLDAAFILNITPDHLDRYAGMDEYARAKCKIESCLKEGGEMWVSKQTAHDFGHWLHRAKIIDDRGSFENSAIATISPMRYIQLGVPERQNIQAAELACRRFGVNEAQFWRGLETFRKPKHRIEYVGEWNGITFYNDSKATNIDSVMHAVGLFEGPIILLAGGVHKGWSYRPWIESFQGKVTRVVAFGQAAAVIEEDLKNDLIVDRVETLTQAVRTAVQNAGPKTAILLSPGCSSFDQFRNYEHRGNEFKRIIEEKLWIEKKRS